MLHVAPIALVRFSLLLLGLAIFIAGCGAAVPTPTPLPEEDIFAALQGKWDWSDAANRCADNPHTLQFSADKQFMELAYAKPLKMPDGSEGISARYKILSHTKRAIRGMVEGETRRTATGAPVVWDLILLYENEYCWHRIDWTPTACTKRVTRCN